MDGVDVMEKELFQRKKKQKNKDNEKKILFENA